MTLPTEPGAYLDNGGDVWILTADKRWYDNKGNSPKVLTEEALNFLSGVAPFTPIPHSLSISTEFRVTNDDLEYDSRTFTLLEEAKLYCVDEADTIQTRHSLNTEWKKASDEE